MTGVKNYKSDKEYRDPLLPSSVTVKIKEKHDNSASTISFITKCQGYLSNKNSALLNSIEISLINKRKHFLFLIIMVVIFIYFNSSVVIWDKQNIEKIHVYHHSHVPGMKEASSTSVPAQNPIITTAITTKTFTFSTILSSNSKLNRNRKMNNPFNNIAKIQQLLPHPNVSSNNIDAINTNLTFNNNTIITKKTIINVTTTTITSNISNNLSSSNINCNNKNNDNNTINTKSSSISRTTENNTSPTPDFYHNFNNTIKLIPPPGYLVWSDKCKMPNMDPYLPEVMKYFKRQQYKPCTTELPHTDVKYDTTTKRYVLHLNVKLKTKYTKGGGKLTCSYQEIERTGSGNKADKSFKLSDSISLPKTIQLPNTTEFILVKCKSSNNQTYMNVHSMMPDKEEIKDRLNKWKKFDEKTGKKPISVLFIGVDSISRLNFIRAMPKTAQYVYDNEWFELSGYNKIEDNTFPNLMAILAGINNTHAFERYNPKKPGLLDKCPLLWQDFQRLGYVTAYAEDETEISTFNYLKAGFVKQPTDYYLRPALMVAEKKLPIKTKSGLSFCVGYKHSADYILDYAVELGTRYLNDSFFGFFWMNTFSHNAISDCSSMDDRIAEYFKKFSDNGILNNSIIIFASDHGMRFGPTRVLESGYYEERLPLIFLWLPPWLKDSHPEFVNALNTNKNRLTNPYDVHMTLKHILELSGRTENLPVAEDCPECQTLFKTIPENRSCQDVAIADHWCTCLPFTSISKDSAIVKRVANYSINYINDYLAEYQNGSVVNLCAKLRLHKIKSANRAITSIGKNPVTKTIETYHLIMIAKPGDGIFEASVRHHPSNNGTLEMTGSISRLNWYGRDSKCLQDGGAKKYCYCVYKKSHSSG